MPLAPWWFKALAMVGAATLLSTLILVAVFLAGAWLDRMRQRRAARRAEQLSLHCPRCLPAEPIYDPAYDSHCACSCHWHLHA